MLLAAGLVACGDVEVNTPETASEPENTEAVLKTVRIATFNVSMYREEQGQLITELATGSSDQVGAVAQIIQEVNPDILLLNEFDYDAEGQALKLFQENFLAAEDGVAPYAYSYVVPSNTGISSGVDLDKNDEVVSAPGSREYGGDAFGYGTFEGQYAFAILSRYPIDEENIRSFQNFLWKDMPDNLMPTDWYSAEAQEVLRLSSKNHVDVPVQIDGLTLHVIAAHPTPPTFDGPEDRNGRRNHDEIRLLADYIDPSKGAYLTDDAGNAAGLEVGDAFVIMGDLNADPNDGDSYNSAIRQLTENDLVADTQPMSFGGEAAAREQEGANAKHQTNPAMDTSDFRDKGRFAAGNLRLDYVLPSANLEVVDSAVYWPAKGEKGYDLVGNGYPVVSSDHRLVWIDILLD
jgi:3-phytase